MKTTLSITLPALLLAGPLSGQQAAAQQAAASDADTAAYRVYTGGGAASSLDQLLAATSGVDVVFLGESHNDLVGHRLQLQIFSRILGRVPATAGTMATTPGSAALVRPLALSLEMFDRDVQYIVDEYLAGLITEDQLKRSARPWAFYAEDYAPLVEAARTAGLPVLAANAPRRYVNMVSRKGPDALSALTADARRFLPPLPYAPPSAVYRAELQAVMGQHGDSTASAAAARENGFLAQSLWDAGMAWSIASELLRNPGVQVVHLVGSFHVKNGTGIPEQLERYRPGTRRLIVYVEPVEDVKAFTPEHSGTGDFVILTDKSKVRADQRTGATGSG